MKRKREVVEMAAAPSEIRYAINELSLFSVNLKTDEDPQHIPLKPFLSLCSLVLQVLELMNSCADKIGPKMVVLRQDINHNIQRLEKFHDSDPSIYWDVIEILKKEANEEDKPRKGPTCSEAFVWLTRSLEFIGALLGLLAKDLGRNMEEAVEESYNITLRPWHGWITSAAYKVALKLVPDNRTLVNILKADEDQDEEMLKQDLQNLISLLLPFLEQYKETLIKYGLDKLKCT